MFLHPKEVQIWQHVNLKMELVGQGDTPSAILDEM